MKFWTLGDPTEVMDAFDRKLRVEVTADPNAKARDAQGVNGWQVAPRQTRAQVAMNLRVGMQYRVEAS